ncbi:MAG: hypothetical protein HYY87_00055, partial [Candidatus Levybacteria bacterium]|nr:hypothetical protein [Candidatus Levybacteria bacterium]
MADKKAQRRKKQFVDQNPIENWNDIPSGVARSFINDVGKAGVSDLWNQLLEGGNYEKQPSQHQTGELQEGEELSLATIAKKQEAKAPQKTDIEPGIDYRRNILYGERRITQENTRVIETKIQEIVIELKRLPASSKILQAEFKEITVEQRIEKPGKYHLSFFEWMLSVVRQARLKVED